MKCQFCGAVLPEGAAFCPVCNRSLIEKTEVTVPKPRRKKRLLVLCLLLVVLAAAAAVFLQPEEAAPVDGWSEGLLNSASIINKEGLGDATYDIGYDHYVVSLTSDGTGMANKNVNVKVYEGNLSQLPCQLQATKNGAPANEEFLSLLETCFVEIIDAEGEPMTVAQPTAMAEYPEAALVAMIQATETSGNCTLQWTNEMKNGSKVIIRQNLTVDLTPKFRYFADEHAMHTDEELDALMEQILAETPENALIQLFLPAVTYEKPHTFPDRCYQVLGAIEGNGMTTFRDTVTFTSEKMEKVDIQNAMLLGSGGTAVKTDVATTLLFCTVQGWDVGADVTGRGSLYLEDCFFLDNGTGIRWNSQNMYSFLGDYRRTEFSGNGTAIELLQIPGKTPLTFNTCTFSGNGTDIKNDIGYPVNLTGANME